MVSFKSTRHMFGNFSATLQMTEKCLQCHQYCFRINIKIVWGWVIVIFILTTSTYMETLSFIPITLTSFICKILEKVLYKFLF